MPEYIVHFKNGLPPQRFRAENEREAHEKARKLAERMRSMDRYKYGNTEHTIERGVD